ncbi:hypothetical protein GCM10022405_40920 [Gibbsiella dentisursi]|uniref:Uncharacterized protein n=1 Tax=Gibbsiella dentisursi TaxID=796890 RepID=A0ABP7LZC2_9GAMM
MNNHFFAIANQLLELHAKRAEYTRPRYASAELNWIADKLFDVASLARCVGDDAAAAKIADAARYWQEYGRKPEIFTEDVSA